MNIRPYRAGDAAPLWRLLSETVHRVNGRDYSPAQLDAWAPAEIDLESWQRRLEQSLTLVAETAGQRAGFANLDDDGHIDCLYCAHHCQGQGVAGALLAALEQEALQRQLTRLYAEVSITARGFFAAKGFRLQSAERVERGGQTLIRYPASKCLKGAPPAEGTEAGSSVLNHRHILQLGKIREEDNASR